MPLRVTNGTNVLLSSLLIGALTGVKILEGAMQIQERVVDTETNIKARKKRDVIRLNLDSTREGLSFPFAHCNVLTVSGGPPSNVF